MNRLLQFKTRPYQQHEVGAPQLAHSPRPRQKALRVNNPQALMSWRQKVNDEEGVGMNTDRPADQLQ